MKSAAIVLAFLVVFTPCGGYAEDADRTVQALYSRCQSEATNVGTMCLSYIAGIADYMELIGLMRHDAALGICNAKGITYGALRQIFVNWAKEHPEEWGREERFGVAAALQEKWPCE